MSQVRVVLVRPQIPGNIGAVARCMENFGAGPLVLAAPGVPPTHREALQRSTRGEHRLHSARVVPTITEALDGVVYAIAASRRPGPVHQAEDLTPHQMGRVVAERLMARGVATDSFETGLKGGHVAPDALPTSNGRTVPRPQATTGEAAVPQESPATSTAGRKPISQQVALLFGSEDNGLLREDLLACDAVAVIPAHPEYPTLNLSHAVAICLYEVFLATAVRKHTDATVRRRSEPADLALLNRLMDKLQHALLTIGYLRPEKPDHLMFPIRAILSRADLTRAEAQILMGLAQQIDEFAEYGR